MPFASGEPLDGVTITGRVYTFLMLFDLPGSMPVTSSLMILVSRNVLKTHLQLNRT